jgi:hypothetical protein
MLKMVLVLIWSLSFTTTTISTAGAQKVTESPDIRCVVVGSKITSSSDPALQSAGPLLVMYYLGRVDAMYPTIDLENALVQVGSAMTAADIQSESIRCRTALVERAKVIEKIAKNLINRSKT